jgi:hypothetical protein
MVAACCSPPERSMAMDRARTPWEASRISSAETSFAMPEA